jgi:two-component system, chemotaxis family, sensor kinase Cph1
MENSEERSDPLRNLSECAREPIQIIGHIQPHGVLFALSEPDLIVRQVSANVSTAIGLSPDRLLGSSIENVLGVRQFEKFQFQVLSNQPLPTEFLQIDANGHSIDAHGLAHRYDGVLILELDFLHGTHSLEPLKLDAHIRIPLTRMEQTTDLVELFHRAAEEIRLLSGFDRVMIYRFDRDWNGEVTAEATGSMPILYLGSRFPESDIPAQARQLFLANRSRSIADVDAKPVPIVPEIGPVTGRPLDLTRSYLRTAAPIHLKYLRNMVVQSSMTLSIVVNHQLWGLVACHSAGPHRLDRTTRSVCELVVQVFATQVALLTDYLDLQSRLTSRKAVERHIDAVEAAESLAQAWEATGAQLLDLLAADGLVARFDGAVRYLGQPVAEELLHPVIAKLKSISVRGIASSNMLGALDPSAASYASEASGALYMGFAEGNGDYIFLLRREFAATLVWAGNPDKAASLDEHGRLRPRHSFAAWKETVRGRSLPWSDLELENASFLREQAIRWREAEMLRKSEDQVRYLAKYDTLTGLLNRHAVYVKLEQCIREAEAGNSQLAVLFVDLDHFKPINDRYGHAVGDQILKITAQRMQDQVRSDDCVGRFGGDEFIIILPSGPGMETAVLKLVGGILRAVEEPIEIDSGARVNVTASIGLSRYPIDGTSSDVLISRSDVAMYGIKRGGGNAFELYRADVAKDEDHTTG